MSKKPLISVVMPAYNAQDYIRRAIASILGQTMSDFELIIVNDASTDKTLEIINRFRRRDKRIRVLTNRRNLQIAESLNKAVKASQAEIVARMDADDVSAPERLEEQYTAIAKSSKIAVVGADMIVVDEHGWPISRREYPAHDRALKKTMFRYSPFAHPVVMFRKEIFEEFGGYDTNLVPCEDIDLWFKIGSRYKFASVRKPLLNYTVLYTSNSSKKLKPLELLTLKVRLNAVRDLGYKATLGDLIYNLGQFVTIWVTPQKLRIWAYNFLRSKGII